MARLRDAIIIENIRVFSIFEVLAEISLHRFATLHRGICHSEGKKRLSYLFTFAVFAQLVAWPLEGIKYKFPIDLLFSYKKVCVCTIR